MAHCPFDYEARDRMMKVVTQTAMTRVAVPRFPSLELLQDLLDVFLTSETDAVDSHIHVPSFTSSGSRAELLLAAVAAGARFVALPPIWKMGLIVSKP